jgi:hypothetical protein
MTTYQILLLLASYFAVSLGLALGIVAIAWLGRKLNAQPWMTTEIDELEVHRPEAAIRD